MEQWHFCKSFQSLHVVVLLKIGGSRAWDGGGGGCHARSASTSSRRDPPTRNNLRSFSFHSTRPQLFSNESESDQILSSDPQQFALLLVSSIVLSWKWWMCSTLQLKRTGFFYNCFLQLKAKCHILGHQFSVVQLICLYLLVNSKGNSRSKLWQTQQQVGGEEILSHENGCASAASMRSRILGICWWSRGEPGSYVNCMQGKCRQNRQWQESCWRLCSWKTFIASGSKLKS